MPAPKRVFATRLNRIRGLNTAAKFDNNLNQINTLFGQVTSSRGPRVIQFALRVGFSLPPAR